MLLLGAVLRLNYIFHKWKFIFILLFICQCKNVETRHLGAAKKGADNKGATKRAQNKKGAGKKGAEQKGRKITMLRHRYIQGRNFFR